MRIPYRLLLLKWHLFRRSDGERILKAAYKRIYGKNLETSNPRTFSEKMFNRMIAVNRRGSPLMTRLADKYRVREYVRNRVGEKCLARLYWHGTDPGNIPFDALPPRTIAKTNHGSSGNVVLTPSTNREDAVRRLRAWLNDSYYWEGREYHYHKIRPRVLVEEFLDDGATDGPLDYRFWCFHGRPEVIQVDDHVHGINPFYDLSWNKIDLRYRDRFKACEVPKPPNLVKMLRVASALSKGLDFVRVDLFNVGGRVYFGELTFAPGAGRIRFKPDSWDELLGAKWNYGDCPRDDEDAL
jgi:hypothetical protein